MTKTLEIKAKIIEVNVADIIEYDNNNKIHGDKQVQALGASIERFSYIDEMVLDINNVVLLGHGRLRAIKQRGYDKVEVKQLPISANDGKALRYLHNILAEYDTEYIIEHIQSEVDEGVDFSLGGIDASEFIEGIDFVKEIEESKSNINITPTAPTYVSIKGLQVPVNQENYEELVKYVRVAIANGLNIGELFYKLLSNENDNHQKN